MVEINSKNESKILASIANPRSSGQRTKDKVAGIDSGQIFTFFGVKIIKYTKRYQDSAALTANSAGTTTKQKPNESPELTSFPARSC